MKRLLLTSVCAATLAGGLVPSDFEAPVPITYKAGETVHLAMFKGVSYVWQNGKWVKQPPYKPSNYYMNQATHALTGWKAWE